MRTLTAAIAAIAIAAIAIAPSAATAETLTLHDYAPTRITRATPPALVALDARRVIDAGLTRPITVSVASDGAETRTDVVVSRTAPLVRPPYGVTVQTGRVVWHVATRLDGDVVRWRVDIENAPLFRGPATPSLRPAASLTSFGGSARLDDADAEIVRYETGTSDHVVAAFATR